MSHGPGSTKQETAWAWTIDVLGDFFTWLKDVAWPWLYKAGSTAWEWTVDVLGDFLAWLKDVAWPWLYKAGSTAWEWTIDILGDFFAWLKDHSMALALRYRGYSLELDFRHHRGLLYLAERRRLAVA